MLEGYNVNISMSSPNVTSLCYIDTMIISAETAKNTIFQRKINFSGSRKVWLPAKKPQCDTNLHLIGAADMKEVICSYLCIISPSAHHVVSPMQMEVGWRAAAPLRLLHRPLGTELSLSPRRSEVSALETFSVKGQSNWKSDCRAVKQRTRRKR